MHTYRNADAQVGATEKAILNASDHAHPSLFPPAAVASDEDHIQIQELIRRRRLQQGNHTLSDVALALERKRICKEIQKLVRRRSRSNKREKIRIILSSFRGIKDIETIKGKRVKSEIEALRREDGVKLTDADSIADVFATFYKDLYRCRSQSRFEEDELHGPHSEAAKKPFRLDELHAALKVMKKGKAQDQVGIIAEMLKDGSDHLLDLILDVFSDVLMLRGMPPNKWKQTKLTVIFKKGDPELPKNYRPIAILPILYKLFSRMFCNRLVDYVMRHQSVDQAAYRKGFSTEDHLLTVTMLIEKSYENYFPVWLGIVALWEVLRKQGVPSHYISLLRRLYHGQTATVQADVRSRAFKIARGVKQGDPISAYHAGLVWPASVQMGRGESKTEGSHLRH